MSFLLYLLPPVGLILDKSIVLGSNGFQFFSRAQNVLERGTEHPRVGLVSSSQSGFVGLLESFKPYDWGKVGAGELPLLRDYSMSHSELATLSLSW